MTRDIIILCDGTSNEISANRSNILRLYGCLEKSDRQVVWYDPGIGTFGSDNAWFRFRRRAAEVLGILTGWGLDQNTKQAYRFLVAAWRPGDRIWMAGFSRGAYTVRVLAGFLHGLGLMGRVQINVLDYAWRAYQRAGDRNAATPDLSELGLFRRILQPRPARVEGLFLFDTVASVIEWGRYLPRLSAHAFTRTNPSVGIVRHALALHERRVMFRPQHWTASDGQDVREVWFRGAHGDVGGGYPEAESALAKVPLTWMIDEMRAAGLRFDEAVVARLVAGEGSYVAPDPLAPRHRTLTGLWRLLELLPTRTSRRGGWTIPAGRCRTVPDGAEIHGSVLAAVDDRPPNLPQNATPPAGPQRQET